MQSRGWRWRWRWSWPGEILFYARRIFLGANRRYRSNNSKQFPTYKLIVEEGAEDWQTSTSRNEIEPASSTSKTKHQSLVWSRRLELDRMRSKLFVAGHTRFHPRDEQIRCPFGALRSPWVKAGDHLILEDHAEEHIEAEKLIMLREVGCWSRDSKRPLQQQYGYVYCGFLKDISIRHRLSVSLHLPVRLTCTQPTRVCYKLHSVHCAWFDCCIATARHY